jgi:hypothetical protein
MVELLKAVSVPTESLVLMLLRKPVIAGLLGAGALIVILAGSPMPGAQKKQQHPIASKPLNWQLI